MSARTHLAAILAGCSFQSVEEGGDGWIDLRMRTTVGPATLSWTGSSAVLAFPCVWCEDLSGNVRFGNRPAMRLEDPRHSMSDDLSPEAEAGRLISFLSACLRRKDFPDGEPDRLAFAAWRILEDRIRVPSAHPWDHPGVLLGTPAAAATCGKAGRMAGNGTGGRFGAVGTLLRRYGATGWTHQIDDDCLVVRPLALGAPPPWRGNGLSAHERLEVEAAVEEALAAGEESGHHVLSPLS